MPIYEYRCDEGHAFEVMQRITEDPIEVCEICGARAARVFHAPAVHFKGSGFYTTDYGPRKRAREKESSDGDSGSSAKAESSNGAASDGEGVKKVEAKAAA
jgi:putative FmdB family regulatory protein